MLQIKKTTAAAVDLEALQLKLREKLASRRKERALNVLLTMIQHLEQLEIEAAYLLFEQLNDDGQKMIDGPLLEMFQDIKLTKRLQGTGYQYMAPEYNIENIELQPISQTYN